MRWMMQWVTKTKRRRLRQLSARCWLRLGWIWKDRCARPPRLFLYLSLPSLYLLSSPLHSFALNGRDDLHSHQMGALPAGIPGGAGAEATSEGDDAELQVRYGG
mmetsp:Transcript_49934/g.128497  ORF Transcript_49934/g.128497 Transcript_49934/m.128497 type:complete len:104 (-) Transcript_49934:475-786(-)